MKFTPHAIEILEKNYYARDKKGNLKEKTPQDLMTRISNAVFSDSPELALDLYEALMNQEVIFGSPVMFNIGLPTKQILAACWVGDLKDDMDSIMRAAHITGIVFKYGSGMGLPITNLRPKNDIVSNSGYASGPLSFLEVFNKIADVVKSGGKRRAAFMAMARCDHPDIEDIIFAKDKATGGLGNQPLENMNISVAATDKFMEAVINNQPFDLVFDGQIHKTVDANALFNLICESAWKSADPGLFFIDTTNTTNPLPRFHSIETTNPCVAKGTLVQTLSGPVKIEDLVAPAHIYCMGENENLTIATAQSVFKTKELTKTITLKMSGGNSITLTPDHAVYIRNRGWVEAQYVGLGDKPVFFRKSQQNSRQLGVKLSTESQMKFEHRFVAEKFLQRPIGKDEDVHHIDGCNWNNHPTNLQVMKHNEHSKLTNDGHENYAPRDPETGLFINKETKDTKKYVKAPVWLTTTGVNQFDKVIGIEEGPNVDVYDMVVPGYNNFIAGNIVVHNCGEVPLHPHTCCNLGHINLTALTSFDGQKWHFDYERYSELVILMTKALDRLIDIMDFPSKEFEENTLQTRPLGLGFMGFAEVCYRLKYPYSNSQKFLENISQLLIAGTIETSIELAMEFGTTEVISNNLEHIADLVLDYTGDVELRDQVLDHGIRNSTWTMLAPTGTTTLAIDAKSYGVEPHFGLAYRKNFVDTRQDKVASEHYYINETFLEAVKPFVKDIDKLIKDLEANNGSCQNIAYIPDDIKRVFEVAHDLSPVDHLRIMAAAQPYVSSAISKTINLPHSATVEDIRNVFLTAWELNLKGVTIYRDGCKDFQPIDFGTDREKTIEDFRKLGRGVSVPRGDTTHGGDIDAWKTSCSKLFVIPGYAENYDGILLETFLAKKSGGGCSTNTTAIALLVSLALRKGIQIKDIVDELNPLICPNCVSAKANGKEISSLSCPKAIAQTLMKQEGRATNYQYLAKTPEYLPKKLGLGKKTKVSPRSEALCPECGEILLLATGCYVCESCGYGKCG